MKILALDIDGVLNSREDYQLILNGDAYNGDLLWFDKGNFVNKEKLQLLHNVISSEVTVVGVSSWFGSKRTDIKAISKFLNIDIKYVVKNTGGGSARVESLKEFISHHNITHIAILDDQPHYEGLEQHRVKPDNGLTVEHIKLIKLLLNID